MSSSHRQQFCANCCTVGHTVHGMQFFRHSLLQCGSSKGSQVLPESHTLARAPLAMGLLVPASSPFQHGPPMESQLHLRHPPASAWVSIGCRAQLPHQGWHHRLQEALGFGAWGTSCPSSTDLGGRVVPLTCSHPTIPCLHLQLHQTLLFLS